MYNNILRLIYSCQIAGMTVPRAGPVLSRSRRRSALASLLCFGVGSSLFLLRISQHLALLLLSSCPGQVSEVSPKMFSQIGISRPPAMVIRMYDLSEACGEGEVNSENWQKHIGHGMVVLLRQNHYSIRTYGAYKGNTLIFVHGLAGKVGLMRYSPRYE